MIIGATSDCHGKLEGLDFSGCDLGVFAGDVAPTFGFREASLRTQMAWMEEDFVDFLKSFPDTEFVIIPGNHDLFADPSKWKYDGPPNGSTRPKLPNNAHFLVNESLEVRGITFHGMSWVPHINGRWAFEDGVSGMTMKHFCEAIPKGVDVLVTHSPPRFPDDDMLIDVSMSNYVEYWEHFGSVDVYNAIERVRPDFAFCGHIHSGDHSVQIVHGDETNRKSTKVYNVSRVDEEYEPRYDITRVGW